MSEVFKGGIEEQQNIQEISELDQQLNKIQDIHGDEWMDVFENFLMQEISADKREFILLALSWGIDEIEFSQMEDYIFENGYPTAETIADFNQTFELEEKFETKIIWKDNLNIWKDNLNIWKDNDNIRDNIENKFSIRVNKLNILIEDFNWIDIEENKKNYITWSLEKLKGLSGAENEEQFNVTLEELKNSSEFKNALHEIRKSDPKAYEQIKTSFMAMDSSFENYFHEFERGEQNAAEIMSNENTRLLDKARIAAWLNNGPVEREGFILRSWDIEIDISKRPPSRSIGIEWSDFRLESNLPVSVFKELVYEYEKQKLWLQPEIDKNWRDISKLENGKNHILGINFSSRAGLEQAFWLVNASEFLANKQEFKEKIEQLADQDPIDRNSAENLKNEISEALDSKLNEFKLKEGELAEQMNEIEMEYKHSLEALMWQYREKIKEQDEKTRQVLEFSKNIGLHLISQSVLDMLIEEVKTGMIVIDGINLDPKTINLADGKFGETGTETNSTKWKENLIKFYNKMISGNTGEPLSVDSHIGPMGKRENPVEMKETLENKYGIINEFGDTQIIKIRENLKASNSKWEK